jgi:hypothetical protein
MQAQIIKYEIKRLRKSIQQVQGWNVNIDYIGRLGWNLDSNLV